MSEKLKIGSISKNIAGRFYGNFYREFYVDIFYFAFADETNCSILLIASLISRWMKVNDS